MILDSRILVAVQCPTTRSLLERCLSNWGFQVDLVAKGGAALRILESDDAPPLAIINWKMPEVDGLEVCRRLRARSRRASLYLILLTVRDPAEGLAAGLDAGADDYVIKPFEDAELRSRLKLGQRVLHLQRQLSSLDTELEATVSRVKQIKRILPICVYCKRIRDDADYWHEIEKYLHLERGADFTHGVCPACAENNRSGGPSGASDCRDLPDHPAMPAPIAPENKW